MYLKKVYTLTLQYRYRSPFQATYTLNPNPFTIITLEP